jgi:hypothetical protein
MASSSMSVVTHPSWQVRPATKRLTDADVMGLLLAEPQTGTGEDKGAEPTTARISRPVKMPERAPHSGQGAPSDEELDTAPRVAGVPEVQTPSRLRMPSMCRSGAVEIRPEGRGEYWRLTLTRERPAHAELWSGE